jgi:hypothetical protein
MAKTIKAIKVKKLKQRDELLKNMITTPGGVARVHKSKKKEQQTDKVGRKRKHKNLED